jgi:5'(3')-deoxyribonucleotidase
MLSRLIEILAQMKEARITSIRDLEAGRSKAEDLLVQTIETLVEPEAEQVINEILQEYSFIRRNYA